MRFLHSVTLTLILKGIALVAGLGVSIIVARALGPEGRGQYALVMTIVLIASNLGSFGLAASSTYFLARDKSRVKAVGLMSLVTGVGGTILSALLLGILYWFAPSTLQGLDFPLVVLTLLFVPIFLWGTVFGFAFLGRGDIINFNFFETGQRVLFFGAAVLAFWMFTWSLVAFLTVVLAGIGAMTIWLVYRYFSGAPDGPWFDKSLLAPAWNYGMKSYIANLFTMASMRVGILFVNHFLGTEQAGLYSTAQQVMELLIIVPSVLGTVLFGRIADGRSDHLTGKLIRIMVIGYLPVMIGLLLFTDNLIVLLFGQQFVSATLATRILLPGSFLLGLEVILINDLRGHGYPWRAVLVWVPVLVLTAVGYALLIPVYGINGASLVTTLAYVAVFAYITVVYLKTAGYSFKETFVPKLEDISVMWAAIRGSAGIMNEARQMGKNYDTATVSDQRSTETETAGTPR
jgi:O-antigen/teichoic acid export membrane protein